MARTNTSARSPGLLVFVAAFAIRIVGAVLTTVTTINPDSTADALGFARAAATIADGLTRGQLVAPGHGYIYDLWGAFLAPFWLLPGPSGLYARLGNALLGAIAVYNVYLIARKYHSHQAGVLAALPIMCYPSFVAIHSTVLREAIVLFGLTTAARLLAIPPRRWPRWLTSAVVGVVLYVAYIMRTENLIIMAVAIGSALFVYALERTNVSVRSAAMAGVLSIGGVVLATPIVRDGVDYLARIRDIRASGRAVYLPDAIPQTVLELLAFSWIGAAYFLYAPFPWMVETGADLLVSIEGLVSIAFTIASLWGIRWIGQRDRPVTVGLLVGLMVSVTLYGVGTVNYGTGTRHRQMFLWVLFVFGAIGIAQHVRFKLGHTTGD